MPKTINLELNIGFKETDRSELWFDDKDSNFEILDNAYGVIFESAEENGIQKKKSTNHPIID